MSIKQDFLFVKMWFETGQGLLSHIKPFVYIAFAKLIFIDAWMLIAAGSIVWLMACIGIGRFWFSSGLAAEATSIGNRFNPEIQEIKKGVLLRRKKK